MPDRHGEVLLGDPDIQRSSEGSSSCFREYLEGEVEICTWRRDMIFRRQFCEWRWVTLMEWQYLWMMDYRYVPGYEDDYGYRKEWRKYKNGQLTGENIV